MIKGPYPSSTAQAGALVQSTLSELAPISSPMVSHIPPFKVQLDPADMDFLKKKSEQCKRRQKNALLNERQTGPSFENHWKLVGKPLENHWKFVGKSLENHWKIVGKSLENRWKIIGKALENHWKIVGISLRRWTKRCAKAQQPHCPTFCELNCKNNCIPIANAEWPREGKKFW